LKREVFLVSFLRNGVCILEETLATAASGDLHVLLYDFIICTCPSLDILLTESVISASPSLSL